MNKLITKNNKFNDVIIKVNNENKTGSKLNHNWEVDIFLLIFNHGSLLFILICNQKTERGYINLEKSSRIL